MPPILQPFEPSSSTVFGLVSVVMMAWEASAPASGVAASAAWAAFAPSSTWSSGSSSPMRPVEQTATSPASVPTSAATVSAVTLDCA